MKEELKQVKQKKRYDRPTVEVISLRPEEAVLGSCKFGGGSGPVSTSCRSLGPCNAAGS